MLAKRCLFVLLFLFLFQVQSIYRDATQMSIYFSWLRSTLTLSRSAITLEGDLERTVMSGNRELKHRRF